MIIVILYMVIYTFLEEENELLITTNMGDKENEYFNLYNVLIILQGI